MNSAPAAHRVIIRDDDTCALTPPGCLERLYRPFLDQGLPVCLAMIPAVNPNVRMGNGDPEGFLAMSERHGGDHALLERDLEICTYLRANPGFHPVQHGLHHDHLEFDTLDATEAGRRMDAGRAILEEAGLGAPGTFVAPYDRFSRAALGAAARRYRVISTGWYEHRRLPFSWWPGFALKKLRHQRHWRAGNTRLLTHPGCMLSYQRPYDRMLDEVKHEILGNDLTVLVAHWWEFFRDGKPDEAFISVLHQTAEFLAQSPDVRVISFGDLAAETTA